MGLTDTHVHFHFPDFDADRAEAIGRAKDAGIDWLINVGTDVETSKKSLELAKQYDFIYGAAGLHPHDAEKFTEEVLKEMEQILQDPRMVAIGEVGLDFYRDHSPREKQKEVFRKFLDLQRRVQKPLILHCRDAYEELEKILKEERSQPPFEGVMHCFSSNRETMFRFLDLGFYISFAGPLTYKKNDALREACRSCPGDRLLFETDAPFLPPQSERGKRNESSYMLETLRTAVEVRRTSWEALAEQTTQNAIRVFKLCSGN